MRLVGDPCFALLGERFEGHDEVGTLSVLLHLHPFWLMTVRIAKPELYSLIEEVCS